jgi:hypothetical protein
MGYAHKGPHLEKIDELKGIVKEFNSMSKFLSSKELRNFCLPLSKCGLSKPDTGLLIIIFR